MRLAGPRPSPTVPQAAEPPQLGTWHGARLSGRLTASAPTRGVEQCVASAATVAVRAPIGRSRDLRRGIVNTVCRLPGHLLAATCRC
jgi:hypothetical protein